MFKKSMLIAAILTVFTVALAFAQSSFQNTCSNISFAYQGNDAALKAVCLRANGTPNATSLIFQGISNQDGRLVQGSGRSTFQQSCGNIQILVDGPKVTLSALCRTIQGNSLQASLPLNGISNQNGNLMQ